MSDNDKTAILAVLNQFQSYYTQRDPANLDACMDLFDPQAEVIGTGGETPGSDGEWYLDRASAREMVSSDWEGWGDVDYRFDQARLHVQGDSAWLASAGIVSMTIPVEKGYEDYLKYIQTFVERTDLSAHERLLYLLRGSSNTLYELGRGERFVWPLRFTAVLARRPDGWKFVQMQFSFPTLYFPDGRVIQN